MKKSYLLYLLLSFFITSCDKDPDPEPASPFLRVNPQGIALQSTQNATATFAIESNIEWRITLPANDWVQLDHSSGRGNLTVKATATNNTSAIARSLEATIAPVSTSTTAPIKLIISQHGTTPANPIQWQKAFGGTEIDAFYKMIATSDGGTILVGTTDSYNYDAVGNHGSGDGLVIKLNSDHSVAWKKVIGESDYDLLLSAVATNDGGCIAAGEKNASTAGADGWLIRLDGNGNKVWETTIAAGNNYDGLWDIAKTNDGYYMVAGGSTGGSGFMLSWVAKIQDMGTTAEVRWQETMGASNDCVYTKILPTTGDNYIVAKAVLHNSKYQYSIVHFENKSTKNWETALGPVDEIPSSLIETNDGFMVAGLNKTVPGNHGGYDGWLLQLNKNTGAIAHQYTYGGTADDAFNNIMRTNDGGYLLVGTTASTNIGLNLYGNKDGWIVKVDASGAIVWQKHFGGTEDDSINEIVPTSTNGVYMVAGETQSNNHDMTGAGHYGKADIWAGKIKLF